MRRKDRWPLYVRCAECHRVVRAAHLVGRSHKWADGTAVRPYTHGPRNDRCFGSYVTLDVADARHGRDEVP
jgi:hypothetical protein